MYGKDEHYYVKKPLTESRWGLIQAHLRRHYFEFLTSSSVFSKKRVDSGTRLLIESMVLPKQGYILDLGCGYGPIGIAAAITNPGLHVIMVDINERAVWLAKRNAKHNKADNTDILQGFLYEPIVGTKFKVILCNPPLAAGMSVILPIIAGAPEHLKDGGLLELVVKSRVGGRRILAVLRNIFGNVEILDRKSGYRVLLSKKVLSPK
ncbi:MAG: class I SAM-dependent methyltransferase [Candidatus Bathyarchaeota archaeon]|nr:MAG: class I SAM-dependent methyltransferase [Candidatus Bathyarchaeota archaeon]